MTADTMHLQTIEDAITHHHPPHASRGRIFSPYRICPIGAHIDHQGGAVLGRTLALGTLLEYEPLERPEIHITSNPFGEARFPIGAGIDRDHWARYAQAAAQVIGERLQHGMKAHVDGQLVGTGLSSSASVGLAYLKALSNLNGIVATDDELVQMNFQLENGHLGLQNGILDPLSIVYGRAGALLLMDMIDATVTPIPDHPEHGSVWIVAYSGVSRELTKSGYNVRVAECHEAASKMRPGAWKLADVPRPVYEEKRKELPPHLRRRAEHFFGEVERVYQGALAWRNANLREFGELMNQSCHSSITKYECGSPVLIELHEIASSASGVYGSRFSGGGYGGCVVALADRAQAESAVAEISARFTRQHPELKSLVFVAEMGDGLRVLE